MIDATETKVPSMTSSFTPLPVAVAEPSNCMDCGHKSVISDPDPNDWFCDDDKAVVCKITPNPTQNTKSKYIADHSAFRAITCSCRPYNLRKESNTPAWCPLKAQAVASVS